MAKQVSVKTTKKTHYEEWMVEIKIVDGERIATKIRLIRARVMMPENMVETINEGVLNMDLVNNNRFPHMYFKPELKTETV